MPVEFLTVAEGSLAYQRQVGAADKPGIVFLGGHASDMTGTKAAFLAQRCAAHNIHFVRFDYRGCGQSPGSFADGTIGAWLDDSLAVFDRLTQGAQIIVGSSMGGWIGLLLAEQRAARVTAFIGVAAAPDFTEKLVWEQLTASQRESLLRDGEIYDDAAPPDRRAPMTLKLIEEGRRHLILGKPFPVACPVRLLQGKMDHEVPWTYAPKIADTLVTKDVDITYIENGDHRLSAPENLETLWQMIAEFL